MKFLLLIVPFFVMSQSTERVSVHLFDLPDSISIQEFKQDISQLNALYEKNGYGADRYKIYSVKDSDEVKKYRYLWISTWKSDAEYEGAHSQEIRTLFNNYFAPKYKPVLDNEIYRKLFLVKQ
jgi:hypothetical protein